MEDEYQFLEPKYTDNLEPYYPFRDDFKDTSIVWFKAHYRISTELYRSRIVDGVYPKMGDVLSEKMLSIFRNYPNLDKSKFRLLDDSDVTPDLLNGWSDVYETYGYTPEKSFKKGATIAWTRPAYRQYLEQEIRKSITGSPVWSLTRDYQTFPVSNTNGLQVGGAIVINKPFSSSLGQQWQAGYCTLVKIIKMSGNFVTISSEFVLHYRGGDGNYYSTVEGTNDSATQNWYYGAWSLSGANWTGEIPYFIYVGKTGTDEARDFPCEMNTSFFTYNGSFPEIEKRFKVLLGNEETDTITNDTKPTYSEYAAMVDARTLLTAADSTFNQVLGDVWRMDTPKLPATF